MVTTIQVQWYQSVGTWEEMLQAMFLTEIEKSQVMTNDVAHWRRKAKGDPDRTRVYLEGMVWTYLGRELRKSNRIQESEGLSRRLHRGAAKAAAVGGVPLGNAPPPPQHG